MSERAPVPAICDECMEAFLHSLVGTTGNLVSFQYCEHNLALMRVHARDGAIVHYVLDGPCSREDSQAVVERAEAALQAKGLLNSANTDRSEPDKDEVSEGEDWPERIQNKQRRQSAILLVLVGVLLPVVVLLGVYLLLMRPFIDFQSIKEIFLF